MTLLSKGHQLGVWMVSLPTETKQGAGVLWWSRNVPSKSVKINSLVIMIPFWAHQNTAGER